MSAMHSAVPMLHDYLIHSAARLPQKIALVCGKQRISYRELDQLSRHRPIERWWSVDTGPRTAEGSCTSSGKAR